ncbi:hypothetical protein A7976_06135 [Methylobacillus sp. MM3]|jgi:hypothetical protein|uniref:hypothetical protein n=1 Tax=Methylobacillus sp. MM3 TaxID=1848039 RepID=UPI0007E12104|nr:hypothetical protein [Methylobacillus sp. MM3]OAJ71017.1 hypothetical protein A7976_06135 [Methylobacillus sp. MM3]
MGEFLTLVLGASTILGGVAAIAAIHDKWFKKAPWEEREKEINNTWWESSNLKKQYSEKGIKEFSWSNADKLVERLVEGKCIVYEVDEENRIRYKLINKSGQVLICAP